MLEAPYYAPPRTPARANHHWVPEASRRARGFAVYAALRSLGRTGLAELVERCSRLAQRFAEQLSAAPNVRILNDVVLNQVLVRFEGANADARTAAVIRRAQDDGTCWVGGTTWHGMHVMRVSVSNWSTTESDVDRSAEAILRCAAMERSCSLITCSKQPRIRRCALTSSTAKSMICAARSFGRPCLLNSKNTFIPSRKVAMR